MVGKAIRRVWCGLGNYYGTVELVEREGGTFTLQIENYDGWYGFEVSKEFAEAYLKEFPQDRKDYAIEEPQEDN